MPSTSRFYKINIALNSALLAVALFLAYAHFKPELTDFCAINAKWDCDIVNKSIYAELFGVPVAVWGALTYSLLLAFSIRGLFADQKKLLKPVFAGLTGALFFSFYLTSIEAFVLQTFCIFCVTQQILVLIEWGVWAHFLSQTLKNSAPSKSSSL